MWRRGACALRVLEFHLGMFQWECAAWELFNPLSLGNDGSYSKDNGNFVPEHSVKVSSQPELLVNILRRHFGAGISIAVQIDCFLKGKPYVLWSTKL